MLWRLNFKCSTTLGKQACGAELNTTVPRDTTHEKNLERMSSPGLVKTTSTHFYRLLSKGFVRFELFWPDLLLFVLGTCEQISELLL